METPSASPKSTPEEQARKDAWVRALTRPHPGLFWLYAARSLLGAVAAPILFVAFWFKYHSLRYAFGDEGVTVSWGILFRQESYVPYRRIQDLHVRRSFLERWLGIATVDVQTASGSASAEIQLEGLEDHDAVRDFLYRRMRGLEADGDATPVAAASVASTLGSAAGSEAEVVDLLRSIKDELEQTRRALEAQAGAKS